MKRKRSLSIYHGCCHPPLLASTKKKKSSCDLRHSVSFFFCFTATFRLAKLHFVHSCSITRLLAIRICTIGYHWGNLGITKSIYVFPQASRSQSDRSSCSSFSHIPQCRPVFHGYSTTSLYIYQTAKDTTGVWDLPVLLRSSLYNYNIIVNNIASSWYACCLNGSQWK